MTDITLKHVLTGMELSKPELITLLDLARRMKLHPEPFQNALAHKNLVMLFEKPSLRTRLSFTRAIQSLGGTAIESVSHTRKTEEPRDLMRVLNGYCHFVMVRTHDDQVLQEMAKYATIPIINGLTALRHPCQIFADLLTLQEAFDDLENLTLAYVGDGNNILHSWLELAPQLGIHLNYCCPEGHQPDPHIVAACINQFSDKITRHPTPETAVHNAHAVYTDVWTSMGFESAANAHLFAPFQVNEALMAFARPEAIFMHCMPMERGKEVSMSLPDSSASKIFTQSENRLHVQKALLYWLA